MSALAEAFATARAEGRAALVAYLAAGDPDLETTLALAGAVSDGGADIIELGIPYSDPLADGPIIQAAYTRALAGGVRVAAVLETAGRVAETTRRPVVLMTAWNLVFVYGPEAFCRDAAGHGVAGVLVPDLLPEDGADLRGAAADCGLDTVFLAAPDTSDERLAAAAAASTGFLYLVSRRGVTGPEGGMGEGLEEEVARARRHAEVPVAVGFGISTADDVARVSAVADGVIVGSALVRTAAEQFADHGGTGDEADSGTERAPGVTDSGTERAPGGTGIGTAREAAADAVRERTLGLTAGLGRTAAAAGRGRKAAADGGS